MQRLPKNDPRVVSLLRQLQNEHNNVGKVTSFVGFANVLHLKEELYKRGWKTTFADDKITVILVPVEKET